MARSKVYIGIDLQPELFRFAVLDQRSRPLMSGERQFEGDGHSWSNEFTTLLQNDENIDVEKQIEQSEKIWGFAPSFASAISRTIFVPAEARPVQEYLEWESSLYLGAPSDQFFLSWEMGTAQPGGNQLHLTSVRKSEFQGFAAGLSHAGVLPISIEGRLFSAWNAISRTLKKKETPSCWVVLEEGERLRIGYFEKGALLLQGNELLALQELPERLSQIATQNGFEPTQLFYQLTTLPTNDEQSALFAPLGIGVEPLPSDEMATHFAVARSAALRAKEVSR